MARRFYEVTVAGRVDDAVAASLAPWSLRYEDGETTISGVELDAAALEAVLRSIERMGLDLVAIRSHVVE
jgi:hypothetical protein